MQESNTVTYARDSGHSLM